LSLQSDPRFDEAEAETRRGRVWNFRDETAPNPLTILAKGWNTGHTRLGEAEFLTGSDRTGELWTILVGSIVLKKRLIDGEVTEWDDEGQTFRTTGREGRVQAGEVVSLRYKGDRESGSGMTYPDFEVVRKPATGSTAPSTPVSYDEPPYDDPPF
jgi:hypothetical protein